MPWLGIFSAIALIFASIIPVRIIIALHQAPIPQAIFVLGGDGNRMEFAGRFWLSNPNLNIWVSDDTSQLQTDDKIFQRYGVPQQQLHLNGGATDTVTNFTTTVNDFSSYKLENI